MTAEHLNISKNTVSMIEKQNFGKRKVADENYKKTSCQCFDRSWCFVCHPNNTPWKVGKILPKLKKMWLQKSWKNTLSVLLTQDHPMRIPSTGPN
jgi:hypothetical protein